jgi:cyclophilin family peptidyl-prolyl cis-trans isomerase
VSQKHHKKQLDRARAQRHAAAEAKQRRTRIIAIVLIAALALSVFAVALFAGGDDTATPEVADDPEATETLAVPTEDEVPTDDPATDEATTPADGETDPAGDDADTSGASYANPQPADAEPCPTDPVAPEPAAEPYDAAPEMTIDPAATYVATVETTCGTIVLELLAAEAPVTVNNFVFLAEDDYYVGVPFHRVINGFMVQGGDPTGTGHGNGGEVPGYTFEDELEYAQRVVNEEGGYPRGSLAMANAGPDTNGSQFFIVQATPGYPLPPDYTLFGQVTEGMDVVDRIAQGPAEGDQAVDPVRIVDITIEERGGASAG